MGQGEQEKVATSLAGAVSEAGRVVEQQFAGTDLQQQRRQAVQVREEW